MLFDIDAAAASWKALQPGTIDLQGNRRSAWRRLVRYIQRHGIPDMDGGLLRVIALFGEGIADCSRRNRLCFEAEGQQTVITADPDAADPEERYLLSRAARILWADERLHQFCRHFVNAHHHGEGAACANPDFAWLHEELGREMEQARQREDGEEFDRLSQIVRILTLIADMQAVHPESGVPACDWVVYSEDDNIASLRQRYPEGLHFAVGDVHGEADTLAALLKKIRFDPDRDHLYFVGDYNGGGDPEKLLAMMAQYYRADPSEPGFHMIRGNHEREYAPPFPLENLPDILVWRSGTLNYCFTHAGMVDAGFDVILRDLEREPERTNAAYRLEQSCADGNGPLYQITFSRNGLYSRHGAGHLWPAEEKLRAAHMCIIHGHTPYGFLMSGDSYSYGDRSLFWARQHVWFSEALQSFDIDANIKGRKRGENRCRGLSCVCLEVLNEAARKNGGTLSVQAVREAENMVFSMPLVPMLQHDVKGNIRLLLRARPRMKSIYLDRNGQLKLRDEHR